jgi:hypothetical protein
MARNNFRTVFKNKTRQIADVIRCLAYVMTDELLDGATLPIEKAQSTRMENKLDFNWIVVHL